MEADGIRQSQQDQKAYGDDEVEGRIPLGQSSHGHANCCTQQEGDFSIGESEEGYPEPLPFPWCDQQGYGEDERGGCQEKNVGVWHGGQEDVQKSIG